MDARLDSWNPDANRAVTESTSIPGLYLIRRAVSPSQLSAIRTMIEKTCMTNGKTTRTTTCWSWFEYDPARYIVGLLPHSAYCSTDRHTQLNTLQNFEVFDNTHPDKWLDLTTLSRSSDISIAEGARSLGQLQSSLLQSLPSPLPASKCHFLQLQYLEAGARVMPHIDADDPPIDIIATIPISGGTHNLLRVAACEFSISPGDAYILSGKARYDVKHEVLAAPQDRVSITLRYSNEQIRELRK